MATDLINIRKAQTHDAAALAEAHEEAWWSSYQGIIPHLPLSRMIARRGPGWWQNALTRGMPAIVLDFDGQTAGYATYGRGRMRGTPYQGEIYELYVRPVYQGTGMGTRLFQAARRELSAAGLRGLMVWALADNDAACAFYLRQGGHPVSEGHESFGDACLRKVAFAWR